MLQTGVESRIGHGQQTGFAAAIVVVADRRFGHGRRRCSGGDRRQTGDGKAVNAFDLGVVALLVVALTDFFLRLAPLQTTSLLASDLDPGVTGYLLALVCDETTGCPIRFNYLLGSEYVKLASGHTANLTAESFALSSSSAIACLNGVVTLRFDGFDYQRAPRVLALANLASRANGNYTLLVLNRFGGDWRRGVPPLNAIAAMLYNDLEQAISTSLSGGNCQYFSILSEQSLRTTPRFSEFIPAARSGWLKVWAAEESALLGFHSQASRVPNAFHHGHNLSTLSWMPVVLILPISSPRF